MSDLFKISAITTGSILGGLTQDPTEHPLAGLMGAGVGGLATYAMIDDLKDLYEKLIPKNLTLSELYQKRIYSHQINAEDVKGVTNEIGDLLTQHKTIFKEDPLISEVFKSVLNDPEKIDKYVNLGKQYKKESDIENIYQNLSTAFKDDTDIFSIKKDNFTPESLEKDVQSFINSNDDIQTLQKVRNILRTEQLIDPVSSNGLDDVTFVNHSTERYNYSNIPENYYDNINVSNENQYKEIRQSPYRVVDQSFSYQQRVLNNKTSNYNQDNYRLKKYKNINIGSKFNNKDIIYSQYSIDNIDNTSQVKLSFETNSKLSSKLSGRRTRKVNKLVKEGIISSSEKEDILNGLRSKRRNIKSFHKNRSNNIGYFSNNLTSYNLDNNKFKTTNLLNNYNTKINPINISSSNINLKYNNTSQSFENFLTTHNNLVNSNIPESVSKTNTYSYNNIYNLKEKHPIVSSNVKNNNILPNYPKVQAISIDTKPYPNFMPINESEPIESIENKLYQHFKKVLNNDKRTALRKAKIIAPSLRGHNIELNSTEMTIKGPSEFDDVKLTLTAKTNSGLSYTKIGHTEQIVKGFNPFGHAFATGEHLTYLDSNNVAFNMNIDAKAATKRYDPEELLGLYYKTGYNPTDTMPLEKIRELAQYQQQLNMFSNLDSKLPKGPAIHDIEKSGNTVRLANTVNMNLSFVQNENGLQIKPISSMIELDSGTSVYHSMLNKINKELGYNPLEGQGINSIGTITDRNAINELYNPGLFLPEERGASTTNYRDHLPLKRSEANFIDFLKNETLSSKEKNKIEMLAKSASHGYRIHASKEFSETLPFITGNELLTLGDSHDIANPAKKQNFSATNIGSVFLPNISDIKGNNQYYFNLDIPKNVLNMPIEQRREWLQNNNIKINSNTTIGFNENFKSVKLPKYVNEGQVIDLLKTSDGLKVIYQGTHKPDDWVKIFGVSSKAGLTFAHNPEQFEKIGAMSLAESRGLIKFNNINIDQGLNEHPRINIKVTSPKIFGPQYEGQTIQDVEDFLKLWNKSDKAYELEKEARQAHMIQLWDEIGQGDLETILNGSKDELKQINNKVEDMLAGKNLDQDIEDFLNLKSSPEERAKKAAMYRMFLSISSDKPSQDMYLTALERSLELGNTDDARFLRNLEQTQVFPNYEQRKRITDIMQKTYLGHEGMSLTQYTPDLGEAIHGASWQKANMSGFEQVLLRSGGHDFENSFGELAEPFYKDLYELKMLHENIDKGHFSYNDLNKLVKNKTRVINEVYDLPPEERLSYLKNAGLKDIIENKYEKRQDIVPFVLDETSPNKNVLRYSLSEPVEDIRSVAIPLMETDYSGPKKISHNQVVLPQIEQARRNLILSDLEVLNAKTEEGRKLAELNRLRAAKRVVKIQQSMITGDNNLKKNASKKRFKGGMYLTARPISGRSNNFKNTVFISEGTARKMYKSHGLNYDDYSEVVKTGKGVPTEFLRLKSPSGNDLIAQIGREPIQNVFSTLGLNVMVDTKLKDKPHLYIPKSNPLLKLFQVLDYDSDHLKFLPMMKFKGENLEEQLKNEEKYIKTSKRIVSQANALIEMQSNIGVKNSKRHMDVLTQFVTSDDKQRYLMLKGKLGRLRKIDTPEVTRIVMNINKAMDLMVQEGQYNIKDMKLASARTLAWSLTENLLKSSHKGLDEGFYGAVQQIQELEKKHGKGYGFDYKSELRKILDKTLGGKKDKMAPEALNLYNQGLDILVNAHVSYGKDLLESGETFAGSINRDVTTQLGQSKIIETEALQGGNGPVKSVDVKNIETDNILKKSKKIASKIKNDLGQFLSKNKGVIGTTVAGLGLLALASREPPIQSAQASPLGSNADIQKYSLQPMQDQKAYLHKYRRRDEQTPNREIVINASLDRSNFNPRTIDSALFGDELGSISINITDKSGVF